MTEANKAIIRRYYDDLWNAWNLEAAEDLISPDIEFRGSLGIDGFKGYVATVRSVFPDFHNHVEDLIAEGNKVVARLTYRGTHLGEIFGLAPTARSIEYPGIAIFGIGDRKIYEGWVMGDAWGLYQQISAPAEANQTR